MCFAMAEVVGGVFTAAICHVVVHRWMMAEVLYPAILRAEAASAMASAGQKHELEDSNDQPRKGLRKERRLAQDPLQCPVCGVTVRLETLASHYQQEFQRLKSPPRKHHHSRRDSHTLLAVNSNSTAALAPPSSRPQGPTGPVEGDHGGTSVMQRARAALDATRRRSFLFRQGVSPNPPDPTTCQQAVSHSEHGLGAGQAESHTVEAASSSSDSEEYEEYTWCDVTRVRATSLLDAGTRANIFNGTLITPADEASSCDLDIETDSSRLYGPTQYPHHHLVLPYTGYKLSSRSFSQQIQSRN